MPFVANLQRHYGDNAISALDFRCKKYSDWKRGCPTFVEPCEGFVGTDCGRRLRASFSSRLIRVGRMRIRTNGGSNRSANWKNARLGPKIGIGIAQTKWRGQS